MQSFEPVLILIDDPKQFGDVAFLIDRDDFLLEIDGLRKKWKIIKLIKYNKENSVKSRLFPNKDTSDQLKKYKNAYSRLLKRYISVPLNENNREILLKDYEKMQRILPSFSFSYDITLLRKKFKRPRNFDRVIRSICLFGFASSLEYKTGSVSIDYNPYEMPRLPDLFYDPNLSINFYPLATIEEISKIFKEKADKAILQYQEIIGIKLSNKDTIANIKRDRSWYWEKKEGGLSYGEIHKKAISNGHHITRDGVIKAIKQYESRLSVEL
jgi:hypothetical protein